MGGVLDDAPADPLGKSKPDDDEKKPDKPAD